MGFQSYCNYGCFFDLGECIYIGNNVAIVMNVKFITTSHEIGEPSRRAAKPIREPVYVGDGSWIGADTTILPGVRIGKGVVVGAGSLVTKDLDDNSIYVGRPAYKIKELDKYDTQETDMSCSLLWLCKAFAVINQPDDTLGEDDKTCSMSPFV